MNYNININQLAVSTHFPDLDLFDATLLTYLQNLLLSPSTKLERITKGGRIYTWVNLKTIYAQLPLLKKHIKSESKGWLSGRLKKLENNGLILRDYQDKTQKSFVCFTDEIDKLSVYYPEQTVHTQEPYRSPERNNNITSNNISSSNKEKQVLENYQLDEMRASMWLMRGYTKDGIVRHTLNWVDYINGLNEQPKNLSSSLDNYLSNHLAQFLKEQKSIENVDKADQLAKERINKYHADKKSYTKTEPSKINKFQPKPVFKPYYRDYDTRADYDQAIIDARAQGQIVDTDPLPTNAGRYWGELENDYSSIINSVATAIHINEDQRKQELYNQANSL